MVLVSGNECALLGLLAKKPRYGYELDKIIEEKLFREWTDIAFSSIYAILRGMETKGLVESKSEIAGNRVRRQYALTRAGKKALRNAVESLISEPAKVSDDFMTAIANISLLEGAEVKEALETRRSRLQAQLADIKKASANTTGKKEKSYKPIFKRIELRVRADIEFLDWYTGVRPAKEVPLEPELEPTPPSEIILREVEQETEQEAKQKVEKIEEPAKKPEIKPYIPEKPKETLF